MTTYFEFQTERPAAPLPRPLSLLLDGGLLAALTVLALIVRVPHLLTVPAFTDEQLEVLYTLPLYRHAAVPLVGLDSATGSLHSYLLALALWTFGPQPYTPRLVALVFGVATVGVVFLLGRALGGRQAGLLAAGLLTTSATHVVVNSHIGWSHSLTPFFVAVAFWLLLPAIAGRHGPRLALGMLALALALQTEPAVAGFLPGLGLALLLSRPRLARSRWLLVGLSLGVVGYGNVLLHHLRPGPDTYREVVRATVPGWDDGPRADRQVAPGPRSEAGAGEGSGSYFASLGALALNLPRVAGSQIEPAREWNDYLRAPAFWLYGLTAVVGLVWPLRTGNLLPLLAGGSYVLLLPLFSDRFEPLFQGGYLLLVLPLALAGLGCLAADLWRTVLGRAPRLVLATAGLGLVAYPLLPLLDYEQEAARDGEVNVDLIRTAAAIQAVRRPEEPLLLDEALGQHGLPAGGDLLRSLQVGLELRGVPYRVGPASSGRLEAQLGGARAALVVLARPYDRGLEARYRLVQVAEQTSDRYAAYRLERRTD